MHHGFGAVAAAAVALWGSSHGAWVDPLIDEPIQKFIVGIPVLNYDQAYKANVQAAGAAAQSEDWIVVLKPEATDEQMETMCEKAAGGCFQIGHRGGFPFAAMRGSEDDLATALAGHSEVARYIHPDKIVSHDPVDELTQPAHGMSENKPAQTTTLWGLQRIGADKRDHTGRGVHVYVCDTGILTDHVDFGGRAFPFVDVFTDTNGTNLCSNSQDPDCSEDRRGHGTHCAGTVVGETYGVAPDALVYSVKVLSDQGSGSTAGIVGALDLIALHAQRPAVISMSLGGSAPNQPYVDAINALTSLSMTVVVSAGNDYKDSCTKAPAYVPSAITVGSTDSEDMRSGFSNFGVCVDIWAPGSAIESADGTEAINNNYSSRVLSGTSMSCPHVSGGAALLLSADPSLNSAQILERMHADASVNYIGDLSPTDKNLMMYVGRDAPEAPQPNKTISWPPLEFFDSCPNKSPPMSGPRGDYPVCMCADRNSNRINGSRCYDGYKLGCPLGPMEELDNSPGYENANLSWYYSMWNCTTCQCHAAGQEPTQPPTPEPTPVPTPVPTPPPPTPEPTPAPTPLRIRDVSVAAGRHFGFFVDAFTGRVMATGSNTYGQLGVGDFEDRTEPTEVNLPEGRVSQVAAGRYHSVFLMESGEIYAAGRNHYGQLGVTGDTNSQAVPVQMGSGQNVMGKRVCAGYAHSAVLTTGGSVMAVGANHQGQLGDGTNAHRSVLTTVFDGPASEVKAGFDFTYFLAENGAVWVTGNNLGGQLGDGTKASKNSPVQILELADVSAIVAGHAHGLFLMPGGLVRGTGANFVGQLGVGDTENRASPLDSLIADANAYRLIAGADSSGYTTEADGSLFVMGSNRDGEIGLGDVASVNVPTEVTGVEGHVLNGNIGESHSVMVTWAGKVYAAGSNNYGELGDGTNTSRRSPVEVYQMDIPGATTTAAPTPAPVVPTPAPVTAAPTPAPVAPTPAPTEGPTTSRDSSGTTPQPGFGVPQGILWVFGGLALAGGVAVFAMRGGQEADTGAAPGAVAAEEGTELPNPQNQEAVV